MSYGEGYTQRNVAAGEYAFSLLLGGYYLVTVHATWGGGSNHLQVLAPDNTTWLDVGTSTNLTADGVASVILAPGQYRFHVATATASYFAIARCPTN